mmetsp:Transcript_128245/g.221502  ORF Transcript_128245/g.221502 Transcript_128245/m.221502 type:complete len:199 (-) Transcript_128245:446-1042(-)
MALWAGHPQTTTSGAPTSHYARLDYHIGRVYTYGIDPNRAGLDWCRSIVGYPGSQLFTRPSLILRAARCRYFHHDMHAMMYHLLRDGSPYRLDRDGVPNKLYTDVDHVPAYTSGDGQCPPQTYDTDPRLWLWQGGFFVLLPIGMVLVLCALCSCGRVGYRRLSTCNVEFRRQSLFTSAYNEIAEQAYKKPILTEEHRM